MNTAPDSRPPSNTLGKSSLFTGIVASVFMVMIGLCAGVGHEQGWLNNVAAVFLILGGTTAFLGLISVLLGLGGLFSRRRATAVIGLVLGLFTVLLFIAIVQNSQ
jgi:uncharacterized membrane protein